MTTNTMNISGNEAGSVTEGLPGLTLAGLIEQYLTHKASSFHKLAYDNRRNTRRLTERMVEQYGSTYLAEIRASTIRIWHGMQLRLTVCGCLVEKAMQQKQD